MGWPFCPVSKTEWACSRVLGVDGIDRSCQDAAAAYTALFARAVPPRIVSPGRLPDGIMMRLPLCCMGYMGYISTIREICFQGGK